MLVAHWKSALPVALIDMSYSDLDILVYLIQETVFLIVFSYTFLNR